MHLHTLITELKGLYGEPTAGPNWSTYLWSVTPCHQGVAIHLCVNIDEICCRAVVWVFDPGKEPFHTHVKCIEDIMPALATIQQRVPRLTS